jgi:hypothetical protein
VGDGFVVFKWDNLAVKRGPLIRALVSSPRA